MTAERYLIYRQTCKSGSTPPFLLLLFFLTHPPPPPAPPLLLVYGAVAGNNKAGYTPGLGKNEKAEKRVKKNTSAAGATTEINFPPRRFVAETAPGTERAREALLKS